ncbi:MAG: OmpA family protein [Alphaproteobacteria bacterium]|nr:OmpA family protein [Alphaproteobacteria bacterium]MCL2889995.1 OmpA family protein [Alphaproteobacteria bacterium]
MLRIRERTNSWPGFVDLFSNLVIILIFLLIVFVFLWTTTTVFNSAGGSKKFAEMRRVNAMQTEQLAQLSADENEARSLLLAARGALEELDAGKQALQTDLASLRDQNDLLGDQIASKNSMLEKLVSDYESALADAMADSVRKTALFLEQEAQLAELESILVEQEDHLANMESRLELNEKISDIAESELALQRDALMAEITRMNELLTASEARSLEQETAYAALSERLNKALADKVAEMAALEAKRDQLSEYQSQFFSQVRMALANTRGVEMSGDRFVISSDILFPSGAFNLSPEGKNQLRIIAHVMLELEEKIPSDVAWIIRVDGHTDRKPVIAGTRQFRNNTELSLLRAQAVVNELVREGVSRRRLVPTGFGELFPVELGNDAASLQKNRRIELRLTNP